MTYVSPGFFATLQIPVLQGRAFSDAVVAATDEATLARMWDSAESLPSLPELDEPTLWLSRTV